MSDTSLFASPSAFSPESQFDVTATDRNLRQIATVERTWGLPPLPDEVRFDLATQEGADEDSIYSFLTGLEGDLQPDEEPEPLLQRAITPYELNGMDQARIVLAGVAGAPAPQLPTDDAVRLIKERAIQEGYLDEGTIDPRDPSWSSEMNGVRGEMVFDDYNARQIGNRPGAAPLKGVMGILNDFTSPTGLLAAATELDLFWDVGAVKSEFSSWGDKWREVGKSKNPLDFAGNLIDALTGPIDDIVIPALNLGLLATGVGAVANTARIGWMGGKAVAGGRLLEGLYSTGRAVQNWKALGEASWTAQRLMRGGETAQKAGGLMTAWRQTLAVRGSRAVLQPAMRLGFASEAEERLGTYQSDGPSLGDIPGVGHVAERVRNVGLTPAALPFEMLLAPYNIWVPGTFLRAGGQGPNVVSRLGRGAVRGLGGAPGRAAAGGLAGAAVGTLTGDDAGDIAEGALVGAGVGAALPAAGRVLASSPVARAAAGAAAGAGMGTLLGDDPEDAVYGALAGAGLIAAPRSLRRFTGRQGETLVDKAVRGVGVGMSYLSFTPLASNQRAAMAFNAGMERALADDAEKLVKWQADVREGGVPHALAELHGTDVETAAGTMGYTFASAAIDHVAKAQAEVFQGRPDMYHLFRNKLTNQLRSFNVTPDDVPNPAVLDEIALARAYAEVTDPSKLREAFGRIRSDVEANPARALEWAAKHDEDAHDLIRQLMSDEAMPDLWDVRDFGGATERATILETYMPQVADTFGHYPRFVEATAEIRDATVAGWLDAMTLAPAKSQKGGLIAPEGLDVAGVESASVSVSATNRHLSEFLFGSRGVNIGKARTKGRFTPLARSLSPGRSTVMLKETMDWQELVEETDRLSDLRTAALNMRALPDLKATFDRAADKTSGLSRARVAGIDPTTSVGSWTRGQIKSLVQMLPGKDRNRYRIVLDYARRKGLTLDEVGMEVNRAIEDVLNDQDFWGRVGIDPIARRTEKLADGSDKVTVLTGADALDDLVKRLDEKAKYTAKRVDVDALVAYHRGQGNDEAAAAVEQLAAGLDSRGYKLVHGVEFLMPEDLAHGPIFGDLTARHLNAATFGNFFKGRLPIEARAIEDRRQRLALADELTNATGEHVLPDADRVNWALEDLHELIRDQHDRVQNLLVDMHNTNLANRFARRIESSFTPIRLDDLGGRKKLVVEFLKARQYTEEEALAVWRASNRFRNTSFKDLGLYALEAKLRSSNQVTWALKTASGSKHLEKLGSDASGVKKYWARGHGKRYIGAVAGAAYGRGMADEDATWEERLGMAAMGGAAGAAAATVAPNVVGKGLDKLAASAANYRFGYLADNLARLRDSFRFTLSPFFDLSRYTEGLMLAQTAAPLRNADGSRLTLPLNMSPTGLRRALRREEFAHLPDPNGAAWARYKEYVQEFNHAARGDYDPDALDSVGRWFKQVGILGFSPTDWMSTAFAHLRRQGMETEQAYQAARNMYTYGTRGRSGAELSVNFIFFPFSFQKKALSHLGKWMNDDLSRSLMIHDALKTYEILDERYDLDTFWREHVPALRQLQKLNLFAYGLSPGRFGGINRQLFESTGKVAWNLFIPGGMEIRDASAAKEAQSVMRSLTPAINDINWMLDNVKEQGHVVFSDSHVTTAAEARQGYEAWNTFRTDFGAELAAQGYKWSDLQQPWMVDVKQHYDAKKAELAERYPAWHRARTEDTAERIALEEEKNLRLQRVAKAALEGAAPSPDDQQFAAFEDYLAQIAADSEFNGYSAVEDAPPEVFNAVRQRSLEFLRANPGWRALWEKYYRRDWGPISVPATNQYLSALGV